MILLLLINYVLATHNITCILLAAPKKIPMLTYTIDYFLNAYNHYHKGIEIEEFYLVKGTDQPFPDIDKAAKKLRESGINVNDDIPLYDWKEGTDVFEKFKNYYTRFWAEYSYNFWKKQRFSWINKDSVINYYNYQVIEKIYKKKNDYPDYLLFIEDDVAMKKTFFIELEKQLNVKYNDESAIKLAFPPYYNTDTVGGESGSPVYVMNSDGSMTVIGIHSGSNGAYSNTAKRIDTNIMHFIYNNPNL